MKIKVSEASGPVLDWMVAKTLNALGVKPRTCFECKHHEERSIPDDSQHYCWHPKSNELRWVGGGYCEQPFGDGISADHGVHQNCPINENTAERYSTDWSQGGPIIEREEIGTKRNAPCTDGRQWEATGSITARGAGCGWAYGPTPLIAAMRCFVASKLGDEVEVPEELK